MELTLSLKQPVSLLEPYGEVFGPLCLPYFPTSDINIRRQSSRASCFRIATSIFGPQASIPK